MGQHKIFSANSFTAQFWTNLIVKDPQQQKKLHYINEREFF